MPIARDWITSIGISPSKLLIPLSNSSILGGQPTFIGSASNLIAKGLSVENVTVAGLDARNPALQFWGRACSGIANLIAALPPCRPAAGAHRGPVWETRLQLSPVAFQANMMVYGTGGYRSMDSQAWGSR